MRPVELRLECLGTQQLVGGQCRDAAAHEEIHDGRALGSGQPQHVDVLASIETVHNCGSSLPHLGSLGDHHLAALGVHHLAALGDHQNTTVRPNSAAKAATTQKRMTVCVSVHPASSK